MFSSKERCIYENNALAEVICQLRFPEILSINEKAPAHFQEAIRGEYPFFSARKEPALPGNAGGQGLNYQFTSADGLWKINLTSRFLSLSCSRYTCWEDFAAKLDKPLVAFIQIYQPAFFDRIGLRYLNFFSRKALGLTEVPFRELISPCYLGPLAEEDIPENATTRCSLDTEIKLRGGCRVKIHAGPGLVRKNGQQDAEVKFIFDQDLYMPAQTPVNLSVGALQTLHAQAYPIFRGAITDLLHNALEPRS